MKLRSILPAFASGGYPFVLFTGEQTPVSEQTHFAYARLEAKSGNTGQPADD